MSGDIRKLVTLREIDSIEPIVGADAIEVAVVGGWKVVVKKGEVKIGDSVFYFEIDSFLPTGNSAWQFLVDKQSRTFNGVTGHRLKTIKLRGQVSQGFIVKMDALPQLRDAALSLQEINGRTITDAVNQELDLASMIGVVKWEAELPAQLAGQAQGLFPSFLRKTDQERCQNLKAQIFGFDERREPIDVSGMPEEALQVLVAKGLIVSVGDGKFEKVSPPTASRDDRFEVTVKLDGSSCTIFHRDGELGVCSRNLQLKISDENSSNSFVRMLLDTCLNIYLPEMGNFAIQGELIGPGIQGNREGLKSNELYIFDVFDIDKQEYLTPEQRKIWCDLLFSISGNGAGKLFHIPILAHAAKLGDTLNIHTMEDLLAFADGSSLNNPVREGVVFKRVDGKFSFKAISNKFLLGEKE